MSILPDFIIVGAQKAGTTWLAARLREHPDIFMRKGEVHFFNVDENFEKGLGWYSDQFEGGTAYLLRGEKTPDYLWTNRPHQPASTIPQRIHGVIPNAKIIIVLRDPVTRALSALNHQIVARRLSPFVNPDEILLGRKSEVGQRFGLIERGYYADQIREYQKYFDNILTLVFEEDIVKEPIRTLSKIAGFLDLERDFDNPANSKRENSGMHSKAGQVLNYYLPFAEPLVSGLDRLLPKSRPVSPSKQTMHHLYHHFAGHNRDLESLLGRTLDTWQVTP